MKKICLLLSAISCAVASLAQTIPTADMESWRTTSAGISTPTTVQAPVFWYGSDSIIIGLGQSVGSLIPGTDDSDWRRQIFKESASGFVHGGSFSAKIMTRREFSFRIPGVLTNANPSVSFTIFPTPGITGIKLAGGTAIAAKPTSVSAWVQYYAGKDSATGLTGIDSGTITVQALGQVGGKDSVIGTGYVTIGPSSSWTLVTANIVYPLHTGVPVDTFRIAFSSGRGAIGLDSSTLYVDDLSMTTIANPDNSGVDDLSSADLIKVYPNPASNIIYFDGPKHAGLTCRLLSVYGREMTTRSLNGSDMMNVSYLPEGVYFYTILDSNGIAVQNGKVVLAR